MKKYLHYSCAFLISCLIFFQANAQIDFRNGNGKLNTAAFHSGCPMALIDWNNDGMDDIIRLKDGHDAYVEVQQTNQKFQTVHLGDFGGGSGWAWAMTVADVDKNGFKDIVAGGTGPAVRIMLTNANGTGASIVNLPNSNFFLQNATFADFNNDGWIDLFCCDDNAASHIYLNNGSGGFTESNLINFDVTNTDDSGNYGSVWTDFDNDDDLDLYIAKCRQGVNDPSDGRRINVLFVNNGNGTYTERAAEFGINIGWQSWTASFGDIDNDGDFDLLVTNHDFKSQILENDGTSHFTDITDAAGFDITDITPVQSVMEDFNNDGFNDLLIAGSDSRLYHNNGNKTFSKVEGAFDTEAMESFAVGDLNHDGRIDVYGGYATIYTNPTNVNDVIWYNDGNATNHFLTLDLRGTESNKGAIGAKARFYGAWGIQVREVRAGESYGTVNSSMLHVGIGAETQIDSVVIIWPSGIKKTILNPSPDQFLTVIEDKCVSPEALISSNRPMVLCAGQAVTLLAPDGFSYLWSTGTTDDSLVVATEGEYGVRIQKAGNSCPAISKTIVITQTPDETPFITVAGETLFCKGESVQLTGPPGKAGYLWSSGATSTSIEAAESGSYTLTIEGSCAQFTSQPVNVTAITPLEPITSDVMLPAPGSALITATGDSISWFDAPFDGTLLGTGNEFTTPEVSDSSFFYASSSISIGGDSFAGGLTDHSGISNYSGSLGTNATMLFDVLEPAVLRSVKVYTDKPGNRKIELRNSAGMLIDSTLVFIAGDQIVPLNFRLAPGSDYSLGTDAATNLLIPGNNANGPRFQRNNVNVSYPYNIGSLVTLTSSSFGNQYFFYFYDWHVETPLLRCTSNRVRAKVSIENVTGISNLKHPVSVFPNPSNGQVTIRNAMPGSRVSVYDQTGRLIQQSKTDESGILNVTECSPGIYNLMISSAFEHQIVKLVLQN